jgi:hypothetical protein
LYVLVLLSFSCVNKSFVISFNLLESFDFNKDAVLAADEGLLVLVDVEFEDAEAVA